MHPAGSVILFTVASGLGFGMLTWLGLGLPDARGWVAFFNYALAFALAGGGLLASTFHLGNPQRFLKAFSQWRSSWLSREAWLAVASLLVMAIYGAGLVFLDTRWGVLGVIGSALSLATVFSTAMIYAQLKTVPRWNTALTPLLFITLALTGGAILSGSVDTALLMLISAGIVQIVYWINGDQALARSGTSMASATGLAAMGTVKAFEPPHTGTNYLLREFVHIVGRKHAAKLRVIALILMIGTPTLFLSLPFNHWLALGAVATHIAGVFTSRWLFFAQAEHVVGLYYGKR